MAARRDVEEKLTLFFMLLEMLQYILITCVWKYSLCLGTGLGIQKCMIYAQLISSSKFLVKNVNASFYFYNL